MNKKGNLITILVVLMFFIIVFIIGSLIISAESKQIQAKDYCKLYIKSLNNVTLYDSEYIEDTKVVVCSYFINGELFHHINNNVTFRDLEAIRIAEEVENKIEEYR